MATLQAEADESRAKIIYLKLLVTRLKDKYYISERQQNQSATYQPASDPKQAEVERERKQREQSIRAEAERERAQRAHIDAERKRTQLEPVSYTHLDVYKRQDKLRLVGNLPYNLSSPILFHALEHAGVVRDMHFMLQKEVVDRMAATPGSKVYGRLSVMLQAYCTVTSLFDVPPTAFRPPPKVDSAVARLVPHAPEQVGINDHKRFADVVRAAFGQRRKTLRNALSGVSDTDQIEAAGLRPDLRAEQVEVAAFVRLANLPVVVKE